MGELGLHVLVLGVDMVLEGSDVLLQALYLGLVLGLQFFKVLQHGVVLS